jgi:outer membrane protein OmpA-like peptidoglycan-associated protein
LDVLVDFLKENHEVKITLLGYTDNTGETNYNLNLSLRRTKSVKKYLVSKGINSNRIAVHGYGEKRPIASNRTSYGRSLNRRVEFIIK